MLAEAAKAAVDEGTDEERAAYRALFIDGMTAQRAADSMYISIGTLYRIKKRLIRRVAEKVK